MSQVFDPITVFPGQSNIQYFEFLLLNEHCLLYNLFRIQEKNKVIFDRKKLKFVTRLKPSDKEIKQFSTLKKIAKKKDLKLIDINKEFNKFQNTNLRSSVNFKIKNLLMAMEAAKICGLKRKLNF